MTDFLNRPLGVVGRLFQFINGATQRNAVDLSSEIQPVFDYSRQAELGARGQNLQGYLALGQTLENDTGGAADILISSDPYALFDSITQFSDFRTLLHRLWLVDLYGSVDELGNANWTKQTTGIIYNDTTNPRIRGLKHWDDFTDPLKLTEGHPLLLDEAQSFGPFPSLPIYLPVGTEWETTASSTDDCISRCHAVFWAGPIGTTPPGSY